MPDKYRDDDFALRRDYPPDLQSRAHLGNCGIYTSFRDDGPRSPASFPTVLRADFRF